MMKTIITMSPRECGWYTDGIDLMGTEQLGNAGFNTATKKGHLPNQAHVVSQHVGLVNTLTQSQSARVLSMSLDEFPEVNDSGVFIRDIFLSNQKDKILVSRFRRLDRAVQVQVIGRLSAILREKGIEREIIVPPNSDNLYFEGGDFRYIAGSGILFAGLDKHGGSSRNSPEGIEWVRDTLEIPQNKLIVIEGKGFHLDTVEGVITNEDDLLVGVLACPKLIRNYDELILKFAGLGVKTIPVDEGYGIYSQEVGNVGAKGTINTLNLPGILISGGYFDTRAEESIAELGIERRITDVGEFWLAGGGVHCLTNQL